MYIIYLRGKVLFILSCSLAVNSIRVLAILKTLSTAEGSNLGILYPCGEGLCQLALPFPLPFPRAEVSPPPLPDLRLLSSRKTVFVSDSVRKMVRKGVGKELNTF